MKIIASITDITFDDLVFFLSTATRGFHYNKDDYYGTELEDEKDSLEEKCAKILLAGKSIIVTDHEVTLEDIKKGLEKCITYSEYLAANVVTLVNNPSDFDTYMADCIMEIIVFGEINYG